MIFIRIEKMNWMKGYILFIMHQKKYQVSSLISTFLYFFMFGRIIFLFLFKLFGSSEH